MKTFFQYAAFAAAVLTGLCACSSDDSEGQTGKAPIAQPQVIVRDVTTSGFSLRWAAVEGAGSYTYTFDNGQETTTEACEIAFSGLKLRTEYTVAVKTCPKDPLAFSESPYTYIHVLTDEMQQLPAPKILLGSSYATRTVISWSDVPETELYEYTIDGEAYPPTSERTISLTNLDKAREYTFSVRALTSDATRFQNSEAAELTFTTAAEDIPAILIAPTDVTSDAISFDVFATSDMTYYYDIVRAPLFAKYSEEQIISSYRQAAMEYAQSQGVSVQLAMASLLKSGNSSLKMTKLTPELSYVIFVFGMNYLGDITTGIYSTTVKTTPNGYSDGPNYGGSSWFNQQYYITNDFILSGYDWTNSVVSLWKGQDVVSVRYRTLTTKLFRQLFPDDSETTKKTLVAFLKDDNYSYAVEPALIDAINSLGGYAYITKTSSGVSYTFSALASLSSGDEVLCVNSVTTKTDLKNGTWFLANAAKNEAYGPTYSTIAGAMQGVDVASCRYALFETSALAEVSTADYPKIVEERGHDVKEQYIASINGNGFAILFEEGNGIEPETSYTFIATATNTVGDKLTKWGSVTTDAAPAPAPAAAKARTAAQDRTQLRSFEGKAIPAPEKFIYPEESFPVPAGSMPEPDIWTAIHNMQILK